MRRLLIVSVMLSFVACGGGKNNDIVVGGNNGNNENSNNEVVDMGNNSTPADTGNNTSNNQNNENDMSMPPEDMNEPVDMTAEEDMAEEVDMNEEVDMADPNCPRMNVALGDACGCDSECSSGLCLDATANDDGFCSKTCTSRSECNNGQGACVPAPNNMAGNVCRPDDTGDSCDNNGDPQPGVCSTKTCVQAGSNATPGHFCSATCSTSMDCKQGHSCSPVRCLVGSTGGRSCIPTVVAARSGNKAAVLAAYPTPGNVCVPIGATNPCDLASDQFACASGVCDPNADRCTGQCEGTDDCPVGGCVDFDVSDPNLPIRVCAF